MNPNFTDGCEQCPFKGKKVGCRGNSASPFMIVGESPGSKELIQGIPFVGPSGVVLFKTLEHFGFYDQDVFMSNALQCHPGSGDKKDLSQVAEAARCCNSRLRAEIDSHPRKVILALGNAALWSLTGDYGLKISNIRGKVFHDVSTGAFIVPTYHPAYILRGGPYRQFKNDVGYALHLLNGGRERQFNPPTWEVLRSESEVRELGRLYSSWDISTVASDVETGGFSFIDEEMLTIGFTETGKHVYILEDDNIRWSKHLFDSMTAQFAWHNGKFDVKFLWRNGVPNARVDHDTMLMSYALDETRGVHGLEMVSHDWLGSPNWKSELDQYLPKKNTSYREIPRPVLRKYMAYDIANTYNLVGLMQEELLKDKASTRLYNKTLIPASNYLAKVENVGMMFNDTQNQLNVVKYKALCDEYEQKLKDQSFEYMGKEINPRSAVQLNELLFDNLKLRPKVGRHIRSTAAKVIKELPEHPVVANLQDYRKVYKAYSTYILAPYGLSTVRKVKKGEQTNSIAKTKRGWIHSDGRVHSTYLLHGTATGRLASRDPNLQNQPRTPDIKDQFMAKPGCRLIEADLNQAELRSLACLSGDPDFCAVYLTPGTSLHELVRAELYGMPDDWSEGEVLSFMRQFGLMERFREKNGKKVDLIPEEQKMRAKALNFGIPYGRTEQSLAEEFHIPVKEARRWIRAWFDRFPLAEEFIKKCRNAPLKGQTIVTVFGHKKRFPVVNPERLRDLQNEASNFPHQSTASTITLHAGMLLQDELMSELDTDIINTVHDSILFEAPDEDEICDEVARRAIAVLEQVPKDWGLKRIPFVADAKMGYTWGSMTEWHKK